MKVYIATTAKHDGIKVLADAVKAAGMTDYNFARDTDHHHPVTSKKEHWARIYDELGACDALLIDITEHSRPERYIESGIAFALSKPIIITMPHGTDHDASFDGIAATTIRYKDHSDLTHQLKEFEKSRNFNVTDKTTLLIMFLLVGCITSWFIGQVFIPLVFIWAIVYWLAVRRFFPVMQVFDRTVVLIPLAGAWIYGYILLNPLHTPLALSWVIGYWLVALLLLRKLKFSL